MSFHDIYRVEKGREGASEGGGDSERVVEIRNLDVNEMSKFQIRFACILAFWNNQISLEIDFNCDKM